MIIDLVPNEDQLAIGNGVRDFLRDQLPVSRLREESAHGGAAEQAIWEGLAELGLFGLGLEEEAGGLGLGLPEEALVAKSLGEYLVSPSVLAQMAATHVTSDVALAGAFAVGNKRAALCGISGDGLLLLDADQADYALILGPGGVSLVESVSLGEVKKRSGMDESLTLSRSALPPIPTEGNQAAASRLAILVSAYLSGIAHAVTEMAVDYAKVREQFGQQIGAFQAIKHQCADMATRAAAAEAQTFYASVAFGEGLDDTSEAAAARLLAGRAALENGRANIQIHGGMGFTAECDAHLFLKRAHVMTALGSDPATERRRILAT